jgi:hypothetical protein
VLWSVDATLHLLLFIADATAGMMRIRNARSLYTVKPVCSALAKHRSQTFHGRPLEWMSAGFSARDVSESHQRPHTYLAADVTETAVRAAMEKHNHANGRNSKRVKWTHALRTKDEKPGKRTQPPKRNGEQLR